MVIDEFQQLQRWYASHCDGDWEHDQRIRISTLDNPGWRLWINLADTELEGRVAPRTRKEESETSWLDFRSDGEVFDAACGPEGLAGAVAAFLDFAAGSVGP